MNPFTCEHKLYNTTTETKDGYKYLMIQSKQVCMACGAQLPVVTLEIPWSKAGMNEDAILTAAEAVLQHLRENPT